MERLLEVGASTVIFVLILGTANWAYRKVINRSNEYRADEELRRMSRNEMISGLERISNDATASPELRAKAEQQLQTLRGQSGQS